jgi:hypothetical protein
MSADRSGSRPDPALSAKPGMKRRVPAFGQETLNFFRVAARRRQGACGRRDTENGNARDTTRKPRISHAFAAPARLSEEVLMLRSHGVITLAVFGRDV